MTTLSTGSPFSFGEPRLHAVVSCYWAPLTKESHSQAGSVHFLHEAKPTDSACAVGRWVDVWIEASARPSRPWNGQPVC